MNNNLTELADSEGIRESYSCMSAMVSEFRMPDIRKCTLPTEEVNKEDENK